MSENNKINQEEKIACKVCLNEVPVSETKNEEAADYVLHFCGLDCYDQWQGQDPQEKG